MFLKLSQDDSLVELLEPAQLWDPFIHVLQGRLHAGEELQDPQDFAKSDLRFLSDEPLPRCWLDPGFHAALGKKLVRPVGLGTA
ncbi:MAG: acetyltransferase [Prochlorococcaceae cyanobacterium]